jgi:hypothetical protein
MDTQHSACHPIMKTRMIICGHMWTVVTGPIALRNVT